MTELDRRTVLRLGGLAAIGMTTGGVVLGRSLTAASAATDPAVSGSWAAPFNLGGVAINAILTHTGTTDEVLFWQDVEGQGGVDTTSYVGTWNVSSGVVRQAPLPYARDVFCSHHVTLPDGRIFVAGGHDYRRTGKQDGYGVAETDTWTPATRAWRRMPAMAQKRWYPTVVGLAGGRALIFGGQVKNGEPSNGVEEFDPATGTRRRLPSTADRGVGNYPRMFLAPDGRIVKVGPQAASLRFTPSSNTWSGLATMPSGGRGHGNAVLLPGATKVLAVGGHLSSGAVNRTAEILDLTAATPRWQATGSLTHPRQLAQTVNLPDGTVLLLGGGATFKYTGPVKVPELYDPATGRWTTMAPQQGGRMYHATALLLPDGRVMSAGQDSGTLARHAEIFSPPYLFKGARPVIESASATVTRGGSLQVTTPDAASIDRVTLIRPGSTTHQIDTQQRDVPLTFTKPSPPTPGASTTNIVTATVPSNAHLLPSGDYMLFVVRAGVPSVAKWVRIS
jgi:hypothetical protein